MDYYQKYLKYKAKYIALQEGGAEVAKLKGFAIPPEVQILDNAYLPGFNIDEAYVEPLLAAAKYFSEPKQIIEFLLELNKVSENGLCAKGNRNKNRKVPKEKISEDLKNSLKNVTVKGAHTDALTFFKKVEEIRNTEIDEKTPHELKALLEAFQSFDDAFLPRFNIDKAYVGHLLYYVLKSNKNSKEVLENLKKLNNELTTVFKKKTGLNEKGDRMPKVGKSFKGKEIKKEIDLLLKNPPSFPDTSAFSTLESIAKNDSLFKSPV